MCDDCCVFFTGYDHPPCKAGMVYADFIAGLHSLPSRTNLPCFSGSRVECEKRLWPAFEVQPAAHRHGLSRMVRSRE